MSATLRQKIEQLQGPILVLGASGFVGANVYRSLLDVRSDVFGTASTAPAWRLQGLPEANLLAVDLLVEANLTDLLDKVRPLTVINSVAFGAYPFETDPQLIYRTNLSFPVRLLEQLASRQIRGYVQAGSSSEYGRNAAGPGEDSPAEPNSHYAASKVSAAALLKYMGRERGLPGINLRLYSIFGPYEDASRLIPAVVLNGLQGRLPPFVDPSISRDFIYVDDATEAFVDAALGMREELFGESLNIGSGIRTTIADVARVAKEVFQIDEEPKYSMPKRRWDVGEWYAEPSRAKDAIGWSARTSFREGLERTAKWLEALPDREAYERSSKKYGLNTKHSVSAVIACYRDGQAIPIMHERLTAVFRKLRIEYEIIFVNDCSPDDSEEVIRNLSARDRRVIGISHSRNFGSQAAFKSGMAVASKNACVLLDGDLQDPPELIEQFVEKWREGYDVVYGRRVKREAPWHMRIAYWMFYRLFDRFSFISIPHDAGDFSLMDRRVVRRILRFPERDLFLRGVRAFVGFSQTGVDYLRPERMFGKSTNNLWRNIGWAKKGILSFSNVPLTMLSVGATLLISLFAVLAGVQVVTKLWLPDLAPPGITSTLLTVTFFGAVNLFAISMVGEYIAKIFEEVKRRPHFLRRSIIRDGEIRDAADELRADGSLDTSE